MRGLEPHHAAGRRGDADAAAAVAAWKAAPGSVRLLPSDKRCMAALSWQLTSHPVLHWHKGKGTPGVGSHSPTAKGQSPAATSAALPLLLPPVWWAGLCGLRGVPVRMFSPVVPRPAGRQ